MKFIIQLYKNQQLWTLYYRIIIIELLRSQMVWAFFFVKTLKENFFVMLLLAKLYERYLHTPIDALCENESCENIVAWRKMISCIPIINLTKQNKKQRELWNQTHKKLILQRTYTRFMEDFWLFFLSLQQINHKHLTRFMY